MNRIITFTFNPAIDKSTTIGHLVPEKKLACSPPVFEPGGGGVNVSRAIRNLGEHSTAVYLSGGYTGRFFSSLIEKEHLDAINVTISGKTRENLVVMDVSTGQQYRFGMPGPTVSEKEWRPCLDIIGKSSVDDFIVVSGSLPPGMPAEIMGEIAAIVKKRRARLIVDVAGKPLEYALQEGVYLIKPNLSELGAYIGDPGITETEVYQATRQIINRGQSAAVVVSIGASGCILVTKDEQVMIPAPLVKPVSTVGAGDSMLAGIVLKLSKGAGFLGAVRYGIACGTAATLRPGTALCHIDDVEKLFQQVLNNASVTMATW
ncbi:1-phosphofructokinase family hexose kinase [Chitinophaga sancti]|uniref:1-phosphofructokinase family hexose kinase n=1 Tax=Chitinophaga sancti TaxID=1004 RepID=A0A1K1SMX5_9BACT|nr:1-phosphofructokinase family hexose kinase [Chitinophaga sancti]WQD63870.1 1-phosphofructokinase family hexose kinase [Chitinophaga sancti]WQG90505.1 1-phosphofructokinase family hexose kinase [Chitinophaga sancti]SFW85229.1 6-phosphofructokinase 2 [Chitinophaga sancti]